MSRGFSRRNARLGKAMQMLPNSCYEVRRLSLTRAIVMRCLHIVHADDVGAFQDGGGDGGEGAVQTIFDGAGSPFSSARMRPMKDFREVPIRSGKSGKAAMS